MRIRSDRIIEKGEEACASRKKREEREGGRRARRVRKEKREKAGGVRVA